MLTKRQATFDEQLIPSGLNINEEVATLDEARIAARSEHYGNGVTRHESPLPSPQSLTGPAIESNGLNPIQVRGEMRLNGNNNSSSSKLHIVRLFGPDSIQNGTQNVTLGKFNHVCVCVCEKIITRHQLKLLARYAIDRARALNVLQSVL